MVLRLEFVCLSYNGIKKIERRKDFASLFNLILMINVRAVVLSLACTLSSLCY